MEIGVGLWTCLVSSLATVLMAIPIFRAGRHLEATK
jgi:hypothetical protein